MEIVFLLEVIGLSALMIISVASVFWYFKMRKKILKFMKDFTDELEREFRPKDKEYMLLGYLVGYRAKYKLGDGRRAFVLLTTTPKHSLFYYPIAKVLKHEDRVTIMIELAGKKILRDAHAVKKSESRLLRTLSRDLGSRMDRLNTTSIQTKQGKFELFYESAADVELLAGIINSSYASIRKISAYKQINAVEIVSRAEHGVVHEIVESLRVLSKGLTESIK
ncbi:MAG: hypothetical protein QW397_02115 [Fervidicoccaceae archaeon]